MTTPDHSCDYEGMLRADEEYHRAHMTDEEKREERKWKMGAVIVLSVIFIAGAVMIAVRSGIL